ncbi:MAG: hypothetical protein KJP25_11560 [Gammaproteobacteria bacterium]|nr:hypothetical protein [Gammaproteobacteria bacterium]NND38789.1 hypothetical protein [Pseudomonadales bacterium]MBT8151864.1 hypothetical protein [Gammaproteobacteria bacterium]NNL10928.1 hypothetical protein [Pseudomonadales bacterium]NNM10865.1 hypothetical protein [Pseudomonadales bacterium]
MSATDKLQEEYSHLVDKLREQRDELRVQIHLAGMEAHDEWEKLEQQWQQLQNKGRSAGGHVAETAALKEESLLELAHDIREGYRRISKLF